jgi:hypothetical protein
MYSVSALAVDNIILIQDSVFFKKSTKRYSDKTYKRVGKTYYYYLTDENKKILKLLRQIPDTKVHIISNKKKSTFKSALNLSDSDFNSLVIGREDFIRIKHNYYLFDHNQFFNGSRVSYFGYQNILKNHRNNDKIKLFGTEKYYYESITDAQRVVKKIKRKYRETYKKYYPLTHDELNSYSDDSLELLDSLHKQYYSIQITPSSLGGKNILDEGNITSKFSWDLELNEITGCKNKISGKLVHENYCLTKSKPGVEWEIQDNRVVGCFETRDSYNYKERDISFCSRSLATQFKWSGKGQHINKCTVITEMGDILSDAVSAVNCHGSISTRYEWKVDQKKKMILGCHRVETQQGLIVESYENKDCSTKIQTIINWVADDQNIINGCSRTPRTSVAYKGYTIEKLPYKRCMDQSNINYRWNVKVKEAKSCTKTDLTSGYIFPQSPLSECIDKLGVKHHWKIISDKIVGCHLVTNDRSINHVKDVDNDLCTEYAGSYLKIEFDGSTYSCNEYSDYKKLFARKRDMLKCVLTKMPELNFKWSSNNKEILGCYASLVTPLDADISFRFDISLSKCSKYLSLKFAWNSPDKKKCYAFSSTGKSVSIKKIGKTTTACTNKIRFINPKNQKPFFVNYNRDLHGMNITDILKKFYSYNHEIDMSSLNATQKVHGNGLSLPRLESVKYRGMNASQYSYMSAIRAMFGDQTSVVESKAVTSLRSLLEGKVSPISFNDIFYNTHGIANELILANNGVYTHDEALAQSIKSVDEELSKKDLSELESVLIDRYSSSYNEWGTYGLYTSPYIDIASLYGETVIALHEDEARGVDMTWHAYSESGGKKDWPSVDNGEYMIPVIIPASDVKGVMIKSYHSNYTVGDFSESYFSYESPRGETYVLIYGRNYSKCLIPQGNKVYDCSYQGYTNGYFLTLPTATKEAKPIGVIRKCADRVCNIDWDDLSEISFEKGQKSIHESNIKSIEVLGDSLNIFYP